MADHSTAQIGPPSASEAGAAADAPPRRFATSAAADFLEDLGWQVSAGPRRECRSHPALACCMILFDGRREEAAFGFDGLALPQDPGNTRLAAAFAHVEGVLQRLGEARGVLLAALPLVAPAQSGMERLAVFGGWRFEAGLWRPFLIAPGGLGAVPAQAMLFDTGTQPSHMAEVAGQPGGQVLPALGRLVRAVAALRGEAEAPGHLRLAPYAGGWSHFVAAERSVVPITPKPAKRRRRPKVKAAALMPWDPASDEFRFRGRGGDL